MDKQIQTGYSTSSSILLTGIILLANLDFNGLLEYGLKAAIGGGIWLAYKIVADRIDRKQKSKKANDKNEP